MYNKKYIIVFFLYNKYSVVNIHLHFIYKLMSIYTKMNVKNMYLYFSNILQHKNQTGKKYFLLYYLFLNIKWDNTQ